MDESIEHVEFDRLHKFSLERVKINKLMDQVKKPKKKTRPVSRKKKRVEKKAVLKSKSKD